MVATLDPATPRPPMKTPAKPPPARVCLVSFGSAGDLHPMLALGRDLLERGWPVTLLSNPVFAQAAERAGLDFVAVGKESDQHETARHPALWHPIDGFGVMWRYLLRPALAPTYGRLKELAACGRCVVVASPVAMGARIAHERLGLPLITTYTAATMLRSVANPMTIANWYVPPWLPRTLRHSAWALLDSHKLEPLVRPALDDLRRQVGLPELRESVFGTWMHSPQAGLALFPSWFAPAAADWPPQVMQAGFPIFDEPGLPASSPALEAFLARGPAPVVFMPGTARPEATEFFAAASRACEQAGERGLLLGSLDDGLLRQLPSTMHVEKYVPFSWLLPRACALVHHGGIGSCAQALRAGIPQLVTPQAYDQFDNAMRLERLGVGCRLPRGFGSLRLMGSRLQRLLASSQVAAACKRWAPQATSRAARECAAALVERFA
jgi:rhamnosyltransferase subunit B